MQRLNFETTGVPAQVRAVLSSTGAEPGTTGSSVARTADADVARAWLLAQPSPEEADKALVTSLRSSLAVEVTVDVSIRYPKSGGFRVHATGARVLPGSDAENIPQAASRMRAALTGPTKEQAEDWLVMLQAACAGGRRSEIGATVALELYAGCLMRFPADVAKAACMRLALNPRPGGNWFPTLAEINEACEALASSRRLMTHALEAA